MLFPELELKGGNKNSPLLRGRFIMPPFSVFDARQGYWQDRKRAWLALGIKSELGRGENLLALSEQNEEYRYNKDEYFARNRNKENRPGSGGSPRPACDYKKGQRGDGSGKAIDSEKTASFKNQGAQSALQKGKKDNGLLGESEQARSHYKTPSAKDLGTEGNVSTQTGTSIFDPVLCEIIYRWFVPESGSVLDPFAGGSVRGIVASFLGLNYTGIDLSKSQIDANYVQAEKIVPKNIPTWICGDSNQSDVLIPKQDKFDFVFSCPPYHDLEVYSNHENDLSAMNHKDFIDTYFSIIKKAVNRLRDDRFAYFVVGEIRDKKTGFYKKLVLDTIDAFEEAGAMYYNDAVLITAVGSLPVRTNMYFKNRKLGKTHQNVLVFYKGNPDKIKENFPENI